MIISFVIQDEEGCPSDYLIDCTGEFGTEALTEIVYEDIMSPKSRSRSIRTDKTKQDLSLLSTSLH